MTGIAFTLVALGLATSAGAAEIAFTDVAPGSDLGVDEFTSPSNHSIGVAWIDFDLDGHPDIFATNGFGSSGPHLYRNFGDDRFEKVDEILPAFADREYVGVRRADYDGDGDPDLYIYTAHEYWSLNGLDNRRDGPPNLLLKNLYVENGYKLSAPLFVDVAAEAGVDDCPETPLGPDYDCYQSRTALFLDYDGDGCTDLYVGHMVMNLPGDAANQDRLYRNRCDGSFEDVTAECRIADDPSRWRSALASFSADLNGDGCPEIYIGHVGGNPILADEDFNDVLMKNNCDGTFTEVYGDQLDDTPAAMGITMGDLSGDGTWELYLTDARHDVIGHDEGNTLYSGFDFGDNLAIDAGVDVANSWGTHFLDADNDGDLDLFVGMVSEVEWNGPYSHLFVNEGGTMNSLEEAAGLDTNNVRGSATADYDDDGDLDILVVNMHGNIQLFRNDTTDSGRSLKVQLRPTHSNPDGYGADILVLAGNLKLRRQHVANHSSDSSSDNEIHFGIGEEIVRHVRVTWPSGLVTDVDNPPAGTTLVITEPGGPIIGPPSRPGLGR